MLTPLRDNKHEYRAQILRAIKIQVVEQVQDHVESEAGSRIWISIWWPNWHRVWWHLRDNIKC